MAFINDISRVLNSIKEYICDNVNMETYKIQSVLGTGIFGNYFLISDIADGKYYTAKIVTKLPSIRNHWEDKIAKEISIRKSLAHQNLIKFHSAIDDGQNIYILSAPGVKMTMLSLLKIRSVLTNPEVRYYMRKVLFAIEYLHKKKLIHRELKLGNIFICNDMEVKIGDFSYTTEVNCSSYEKSTILCTPYYVAPEVLEGNDYGTEVDIWSFGCILYMLFVGKRPFSKFEFQDSNINIKLDVCEIPLNVNLYAAKMLGKIFKRNPQERPNATELLSDPYLFSGYTPRFLPFTALETCPFKIRSPNSEHECEESFPFEETYSFPHLQWGLPLDVKSEKQLIHLKTQLLIALSSEIKERPDTDDWNEVPNLQSAKWICSWVDLSEDYGFGYRVNDGSTGILFVDASKMIVHNDKTIMYISENNIETQCCIDSHPKELKRKIDLIKIFTSYFFKHCPETSEMRSAKKIWPSLPSIGYIVNWIYDTFTVVMLFSTGLLQINYLKDNFKIILCPLNGTVTIMHQRRIPQTYKLELIQTNGCTKQLENKLWYAWREIHRMIERKALLPVQVQ